MSWKLVRDNTEQIARAMGVSGQWRESKDPQSMLIRKVTEEFGEFLEAFDVAELYDMADVLAALIGMMDPHGIVANQHKEKVKKMGGFTKFIEWTPVPENDQGWE